MDQLVHVAVIGLDIVDFSVAFDEGQKQRVLRLNQIIKDSLTYASITDSITLPTGDGAYIVMLGRGSGVALELGIQICKSINNSLYNISIRIGINEGSTFIIPDINGNRNIVGNVINLTQRVMDFGDAGHILLSETAFQSLKSDHRYAPHITPIPNNPVSVKHGVPINLYSYSEGECGSKANPIKNANNIGIENSSIGRSVPWGELMYTQSKLKLIGNSIPLIGEPQLIDGIEELISKYNTEIKILILNPISLACLIREHSSAYNSLTELRDTIQYTYKILLGLKQRLLKNLGGKKMELLEVKFFDSIPTFTAFITDEICHVSWYVEHLSGSRGPYFRCKKVNAEKSMYACIESSFDTMWTNRSSSIFDEKFLDRQKELITQVASFKG